jgi:hypothetical protein
VTGVVVFKSPWYGWVRLDESRRTLFFDARGVDVCVDDFVEFDEALDKSSNRVHLVAVNVRRRMADVA